MNSFHFTAESAAMAAMMPNCVPLTSGTKTTPRTKAKPSHRDSLRKRAQQCSAQSAADATAQAPYYSVLAYDPLLNIATVQKRGSSANAAHRVCLDSNRCLGYAAPDGTEKPCPCQQAIDALNGQLLAERLLLVDACKCRKIVVELEAANPRVLCEAPPFWCFDSEFIPREDTIDAHREDAEDECEREAQENAYWEGTL